MTEKKAPEKIDDQELDQAQGGAGYLKLGDIDGESTMRNSFDLAIKKAEVKDFDGVRATGIRIQHDDTKLRK